MSNRLIKRKNSSAMTVNSIPDTPIEPTDYYIKLEDAVQNIKQYQQLCQGLQKQNQNQDAESPQKIEAARMVYKLGMQEKMYRQGKLMNQQQQIQGMNQLLDKYKDKITTERSQNTLINFNKNSDTSFSPSPPHQGLRLISPQSKLNYPKNQNLKYSSYQPLNQTESSKNQQKHQKLTMKHQTQSLLSQSFKNQNLLPNNLATQRANEDIFGISHQFTMPVQLTSNSQNSNKYGNINNQQVVSGSNGEISNRGVFLTQDIHKSNLSPDYKFGIEKFNSQTNKTYIQPFDDRNSVFSSRKFSSQSFQISRNQQISQRDLTKNNSQKSSVYKASSSNRLLNKKENHQHDQQNKEQKNNMKVQGIRKTRNQQEKMKISMNRQREVKIDKRASNDSLGLRTVKFDSSLKSNRDSADKIRLTGVNGLQLNIYSTDNKASMYLSGEKMSLEGTRTVSKRSPDNKTSVKKFLDISPHQIVKAKIQRIRDKKEAKNQNQFKFELEKSQQYLSVIQSQIKLESNTALDQSQRFRSLLQNRQVGRTLKISPMINLKSQSKKPQRNQQLSRTFVNSPNQDLKIQGIQQKKSQNNDSFKDMMQKRLVQFKVQNPKNLLSNPQLTKLQQKGVITSRVSIERNSNILKSKLHENSTTLNHSFISQTVDDRQVSQQKQKLQTKKFIKKQQISPNKNSQIGTDQIQTPIKEMRQEPAILVNSEYRELSSLRLISNERIDQFNILDSNIANQLAKSHKQNIEDLDQEILGVSTLPVIHSSSKTDNRQSILQFVKASSKTENRADNNSQLAPLLAQQILSVENNPKMKINGRMLKQPKITPSFPVQNKILSQNQSLSNQDQNETISSSKNRNDFASSIRKYQGLTLNADRYSKIDIQSAQQPQQIKPFKTQQQRFKSPYSTVISLNQSPIVHSVLQSNNTSIQEPIINIEFKNHKVLDSPKSEEVSNNNLSYRQRSIQGHGQLRQLRLQNNMMLQNVVRNYTSQRERQKMFS
eukprot:403366750